MPSILADIYWAGSLLPEILTILFTQSTAVLQKYLNDELKILCLLQSFPEVAQNSLSFPFSEKSPSIPGFPGMWPSCPNLKPENSKIGQINDDNNKHSSSSSSNSSNTHELMMQVSTYQVHTSYRLWCPMTILQHLHTGSNNLLEDLHWQLLYFVCYCYYY